MPETTEADCMTPFLTGWLVGALDKDGRDCMKIVKTMVEPPNGFTVLFASGTKLAVRITEVKEEPG